MRDVEILIYNTLSSDDILVDATVNTDLSPEELEEAILDAIEDFSGHDDADHYESIVEFSSYAKIEVRVEIGFNHNESPIFNKKIEQGLLLQQIKRYMAQLPR